MREVASIIKMNYITIIQIYSKTLLQHKGCSKTQIASDARESTQFCNRFYLQIHLLSVSNFTVKKFQTNNIFSSREKIRLSDTTHTLFDTTHTQYDDVMLSVFVKHWAK